MAYAKTKAPNEGLQKLKKSLSEHTVGNCYVFYGEERYLCQSCLEQLKKELIPAGMESFNLHQFQGKDLEVQTLADAVDAFPMMCERTMVIVQDYDLYKSESRREALIHLLSDLPDYVCLVFVYDLMEYRTGGNTKLGKLIKQKAVTVHFEQQSQSDLNAWIRHTFHRYGKEIDNEQAEYLTFLCGGLMTGLEQEIDKIAHYSSGLSIGRSDIDAVADPILDARVFQMTNAISSRNFQQAAEILSELYLMRTEPIMILAVLGRQIRQIWCARLVLENRRGQNDLAAIWGIKSSWQAAKLADAARRFDLRWCQRAVVLCAETDFAMKSSGLNNQELLVELLLKLAQ